MPYLALFLILYCFLKTFYYGIYEIKQKQNKPGGIAVCLFAILRTYLSEHYVICFLYHLIFHASFNKVRAKFCFAKFFTLLYYFDFGILFRVEVLVIFYRIEKSRHLLFKV